VSFKPIDPSKSPVKTLVREARMAGADTPVNEARFSLSHLGRVETLAFRRQLQHSSW